MIFQGETGHAEHIGKGVTHALAQIQVTHQIPVIHGVFVFDDEKQAKVQKTQSRNRSRTNRARNGTRDEKYLVNADDVFYLPLILGMDGETGFGTGFAFNSAA